MKTYNCVECGKTVSSELATCPHCNRPAKFSVCNVCGKNIRFSEGVGKGLNPSYLFHSSCVESFLSKPFSCPSCETKISLENTFNNLDEYGTCKYCKEKYGKCKCELDISEKAFRFHSNNCPNCGHYFERCRCGLPILPNDSVRVQGGQSGPYLVHKMCKKTTGCALPIIFIIGISFLGLLAIFFKVF